MEQNEQLKRIEDKLDILISAMSVHPEFGVLVRQGKREMFKAQKSEELINKSRHWEATKMEGVQGFLETYEGKNSSLWYRLYNIQDTMRLGLRRMLPPQVADEQKQEILKAIGDRDGNPELAKYLDANVGKPIDFESELKSIMEEYDRQQESTTENI